MSKPDNKTTWANADTALKVPVSAARQDFGWLQVGSTGERPPIEEVNGWMNAMGVNLDWIGDEASDDLGVASSFTDLWEWDTSRVKDSLIEDPMCQFIGLAGLSGLVFRVTNGGAETSNDWTDYKLDCLQGARQWEFIHMMNKGLAISLVDGDDVRWIVWAQSELSTGNVSLAGSAAIGGACTFTIKDPATSTNNITKILPDGTTSSPTTFDDFVDLDSEALFDTKNPNGIRVGPYGTGSAVFSCEGLSRFDKPNYDRVMIGTPLRKKWIRPYVISRTISGVPQTFAPFSFDFRLGGRYAYEINMALDPSTLFTGDQSIYANDTSNVDLIRRWEIIGSSHESKIIKGEFTYLGDPLTAGLTINVNAQFARPFLASTNLDSLYDEDQFFYNYMTIEELY